MSSSLWPAERIAFAVLATYLMHSTLLLGGAWVLLRLGRVRSDWLIERTWKLAAAAGLATAPLSLLSGITQPVYTFAIIGVAPEPVAVNAVEPELTIEPAPGPQELALEPSLPAWLLSPDAPEERHTTDRDNKDSSTAAEPVVAEPPAPPAATDSTGRGASMDIPAALPAREIVVRLAVLSVAITAVFGAIRLLVQARCLERRLARETRSCDGRAAAMLARILKSSGCRRRVRLVVADSLGEAAAYGMWRPTIVLPRDAEDLPRHELEAVLAHEAAHLVRGDTRWLLIGRALCGCLPIQPLNFIARREWRRAEEFLCDDWAVRHGARALSLAERLTHAAEQQLPLRTLPPGLAFAGSRQTLARRVERLVRGEIGVDAWERPRRRRVLVVAAAIIFAAIGVWGPRGSASLAGTETALHDRKTTQRSITMDGADADQAQFASHATPDEVSNLAGELRQLERELHRAEALLRRLPPDAESAALVGTLRQRMHDVRRRLPAVNK